MAAAIRLVKTEPQTETGESETTDESGLRRLPRKKPAKKKRATKRKSAPKKPTAKKTAAKRKTAKKPAGPPAKKRARRAKSKVETEIALDESELIDVHEARPRPISVPPPPPPALRLHEPAIDFGDLIRPYGPGLDHASIPPGVSVPPEPPERLPIEPTLGAALFALALASAALLTALLAL